MSSNPTSVRSNSSKEKQPKKNWKNTKREKLHSRSSRRLLLSDGRIINCCHTTVQENRDKILFAGPEKDCERLRSNPELLKQTDKLARAMVVNYGDKLNPQYKKTSSITKHSLKSIAKPEF